MKKPLTDYTDYTDKKRIGRGREGGAVTDLNGKFSIDAGDVIS